MKIISVNTFRKIINCHGPRFYSSLILPTNDEFTWHTSKPVKLRMEDSAPGNHKPLLVQEMMRQTVSQSGNHTAIVSHDDTIKWTYDEYYAKAVLTSKAFISLGLTPGHGVGIMALNHPNWHLSNLGAIFAGGLSCGIYNTSSPATVKYISKHAPLDIIVIQNKQWLQNILDKEPSITDIVNNFILIEHPGDDKLAGNVLHWDDFIEQGKHINDRILDEKEKNQAINKACMLMYTSGTTGPPKGAMMSHDNLTWTARICVEQFNHHKERLLCYLPLSHIAANMTETFASIYGNHTVYFADDQVLKGTLVDNLKHAQPTTFLGVPRVWDKLAEALQQAEKSNTGLKKKLVDWAKAEATEHHKMVREGRAKVGEGKWTYKLAQKLVLSKIHKAIGLDATKRLPAGTQIGSAPMNMETYKYFESIDLVLSEIFGCTEASGPQLCNLEGPKSKPGSLGVSYRGVHNKIINPDSNGIGEIAVRSRNVFMGYHKDEAKTKEAFQDGWFRTGDLGKLDDQGLMWLVGRLKELVITSGGENIPPVPIEDRIKSALPNLLSNVMVVGDQRKYLTCLVTIKCKVDENTQPTCDLDPEALAFCQKITEEDIKTVEDAKKSDKVNEVIMEALAKANSEATANPHKVQKFTILPMDFSLVGGELGPTLKLKRHFVMQKYSKEIDDMYQ